VAVTPVRSLDLATVRDWRRWLARHVRAFDAGRLSSTDLTRVAYVANIGGRLCESETVDALRDDLERIEHETRAAARATTPH
jgi:hypothetical protein